MILNIGSGDEMITVEVTVAAGQRKVRAGDTEVLCDWIELPGGQYSMILDGHVFDLSVILDTGTCVVGSRAGTHSFRVSDPRRLGFQQGIGEGIAGLQRICADMPGKIIRLLVKEGDSVQYEQGLLVLEAMKMQNEIRAPKNGIVREVGVNDGMAVNTGDFLLSIE